MNSTLLYLDASGLVKLVRAEAETTRLFGFLQDWPVRVSSVIARVEVLRAVRRVASDTTTYRRAEEVLLRVGLIALDETILEGAGRSEPPELRSLDAIHLATAVTVRNDLGGIVTYDIRLAEAARRAGFPVFAPGAASLQRP